MENAVAVAVTLESGERRFFLTWGRIQHTVDPQQLEALVLRHAGSYDLGGTPAAATVRYSLREAEEELYFYEGLLSFARADRPDSESYAAWRDSIAEEMQHGRHLYYLGRIRT
jgi:hypothetical protein